MHSPHPRRAPVLASLIEHRCPTFRREWIMSARTKPSRPTVSLSVEQLENRELLKSGPFDTPVFHAEIRQLMRSNDLPQISLAARIDSRMSFPTPKRPRHRLRPGNLFPSPTAASSIGRTTSARGASRPIRSR